MTILRHSFLVDKSEIIQQLLACEGKPKCRLVLELNNGRRKAGNFLHFVDQRFIIMESDNHGVKHDLVKIEDIHRIVAS